MIEFYVIFERTSKYYSTSEQTYQSIIRLIAPNYEEAFKDALNSFPKDFMDNIPDGEGVSIQVKPVPKECLIKEKSRGLGVGLV